MRTPSFVFIILINLFLISSCSSGRDNNHEVKLPLTKDGLSHTQVQAIYEDSEGYLWVGCKSGLTRYDGYEYKIYDRNKGFPDNASVIVSDIYETKNDTTLLVATEESGIFKLNRKLNRFELDTLLSNKNREPAYLRVQRIFEDKNSCLWIGYAIDRKGIEKWDKNREKIVFTKKTSYVNDIYEDNSGGIWVSCNDGLFKCEKDSNKLDSIDLHFEKVPEIVGIIELEPPYNNWLLVGSNGKGVFVINRDGRRIDKKEATNFLGEMRYLIENESVKVKAIERTGNFVWIGCSNGLYCYSIDTKKLILDPGKENQDKWLPYPIIMRLGVGKKADVLWIGLLHSGIKKLNLNEPLFTHIECHDSFATSKEKKRSLSGNCINTIFEDSTYLYIGFESKGGIDKIDKKTLINKDTLGRNSLFFKKTQTQILEQSSVTGIAKYSDSIIICCSWDKGAYRVNKKTGDCTRLDKNLDKQTKLWHIMKDSNNRIWIASTDSVFTIEEKNGIPKYVACRGKRYWFLFEDHDGIVVGARNGLIHLDSTGKESYTTLPDCYVTFIAKAAEPNELWVATHGNGIYLVDKTNKDSIICQYTEEDGLPSNVVYSLGLDKNNNLWIVTTENLCMIRRSKIKNKETSNIIIFNERHGIKDMEYQVRAFYKGLDNTLYFGGVSGSNFVCEKKLDEIDKDTIKNDTTRKNIKITDFKLFDNKNKEITKNSIIDTIQSAISQNSIIKLKDGQQISLCFAVIDFLSNKEYKYYYSITKRHSYNPFHQNDTTDVWRPMSKRIVELNDLSSEYHYKLNVKAKTSDGQESEIKLTELYVSPSSLWEILWVRIFVIVILIAGAILLTFLYLRKKWEKAKKYGLNQVELLIIKLLVNGMLDKEIQEELKKKGHRIRGLNHKQENIAKKLGVENKRAVIVSKAVSEGLDKIH